MWNFSKKFMADESGATAIEYALLAALIAVALITGMKSLTTSINSTFNNVKNEL